MDRIVIKSLFAANGFIMIFILSLFLYGKMIGNITPDYLKINYVKKDNNLNQIINVSEYSVQKHTELMQYLLDVSEQKRIVSFRIWYQDGSYSGKVCLKTY